MSPLTDNALPNCSKYTISDPVSLAINTLFTPGACTPSLYWFLANIIRKALDVSLFQKSVSL